ncbi:MAG TPA: alpha-L-fucosidase [Terracidiphilus sp.]|nr:alpha-L-fucosidase [Terracidiphilus sp.]
MNKIKISRRNLILGATQLAAAAALPRGLSAQAQTSSQQSNAGAGRAAWMQNPHYAWGVMTHYLADWQARVHELDISASTFLDQWNKMVDGFDVEGMAKRLEQVGAGHYQISIGQNSGYYLSPNAVYDKIVGIMPSKCSHRDLVADLYEPLHKRDIKLMVYLPSGAPGQDKQACAALEWLNGPYPNKNFQRKWEQIIAEWSRRWGKNVVGWWFDGCYFPNTMYRSPEAPNFASFAAAARAGNPDSAVAFNPGVIYRLISVSPDEDFTAGEIDKPDLATVRRSADGRIDGTQIHMLSFLGKTWGMGAPRFSTDQVVEYTKKIRDAGGSVTWDVPVELDGAITDPFMEQLTALGKAFPRTAA